MSCRSPHLVRHHPGSPLVPIGNTSSTNSHRRDASERATLHALHVVMARVDGSMDQEGRGELGLFQNLNAI
jgi:hypothetical protein